MWVLCVEASNQTQVDYIITKHPQADLDRVSQKAISEAKLASISEDLKITQLKTLPITRDKCDILLAYVRVKCTRTV